MNRKCNAQALAFRLTDLFKASINENARMRSSPLPICKAAWVVDATRRMRRCVVFVIRQASQLPILVNVTTYNRTGLLCLHSVLVFYYFFFLEGGNTL